MNSEHDLPLSAVDEARLAGQLDALRTALDRVSAPAHLEESLRREFRGRRAPRSWPRLWWMPPLAMAATLAAVSWIAHGPLAVPVTVDTYAVPGDPGPFLALKSFDRIALEPGASVVTTEFPRVFLAQWGLPVAPERADEPVRAQMLYSSGGEALAVRILD